MRDKFVTIKFSIDPDMTEGQFLVGLQHMYPTTPMKIVLQEPKTRTVDKMKAILDAQLASNNWPKVVTEIRTLKIPSEPELSALVDLTCEDQQVMFCFDTSGEHFLGICNWKG